MNAARTIFAGALASAALVLSACGGHSTGNMLPSGSGPKTMANFVIVIPSQPASASKKPNYISPNTKSATIGVSGQSPVTANLTPTSPGCTTPSGGSLTCTVPVAAPAGSDTFTIALFDAANGTGHQLSSGTVTATITAGTTNNVPVTLNGIVATVSIALANAAPYVGSAVTIPVTVTAKDASGATIIAPGGYSPAITLTDSDTSGHTTLSTTTVSAPGTSVTLAYDGNGALTSATISATVTGTITSVTPATLRPQNQTGSGGVSVATIGNTTYAEVPTAAGLLQIALGSNGTISGIGRHPELHPMTSPSPAPSASPLVLTPAPDACSVAPSGANIYAYCVSFALTPQVINVVNLTSGTPTLASTITTDATASQVSWSGGACYICGVAWDPKDSAILISTANGYEFYGPTTGKQTKPTIPVAIAENFGYNPSTDQIWSANYSEADLVDVGLGAWYVDKDAAFSTPNIDSGAVDSSTNVAMSLDENGSSDFIVPLSGATLSTPAPTASAPGTFTDSLSSALGYSSGSVTVDSGCESTAISIDPTSHVAFISGEFSSPDCFGTVQLPSTTPTAPVTPTNYVWVPAMPNTPDGAIFSSAYDPHVAATFYLPGSADLYGVIFNYTRSYVAVVDLTKLLALAGTSAMSTTDPHQVSSTYDLVANGILTYIATGYSGGPASSPAIRHPAMRR